MNFKMGKTQAIMNIYWRPNQMKTILCTAFVLTIAICHVASGATVIDFEDATLVDKAPTFFGTIATGVRNSYTLNDTTSPSPDFSDTLTSHGAEFNSRYSYNCCPGAWTFSSQNDTSAGGDVNQLSAFSATGVGASGSSQYGLANNNFQGDATISFAEPTNVQGGYFANTSYAYFSMLNGDSFTTPYDDGNFFRLDIIGLDEFGGETGTVEFLLADYVDSNSTPVDDWTWVDLTPLGDDVKSLEFLLDSNKLNSFGVATPLYFALDDLTIGPVQSVPEPSSLLVALVSAIAMLISYRRLRR